MCSLICLKLERKGGATAAAAMVDLSRKRCPRQPLPLPDEMLMEIFSRLPLDSALRCRCVCKSWLALLTHGHLDPSDYSVNLFPRPSMSGFFYCRPNQSSCHYAPTFPHRGQRFRLKPPIGSSTPLPLLDKRIFLLDSCNGLLLFGRGARDRYHSLVLCNPAAKKDNWANVNINIQREIRRYPGFILLGAKLVFDRRASPVHFKCLLFFYNWQEPWEYPLLMTFSSDTGNYEAYDVNVRPWGPEYFGDGSSWSILVSGVGEKGATLWPYRYHCTSAAPARRLMGESRGIVHMALCNDRHEELLVWALAGSCRWELKHIFSSRALVERHKLSHQRVCDGARNYSILPLAFHPDFDVVFLQIEWRIYSLHLSSCCLDEVVGERGANPMGQRFVFCPFAGDPLANFGGKTEYDQLANVTFSR